MADIIGVLIFLLFIMLVVVSKKGGKKTAKTASKHHIPSSVPPPYTEIPLYGSASERAQATYAYPPEYLFFEGEEPFSPSEELTVAKATPQKKPKASWHASAPKKDSVPKPSTTKKPGQDSYVRLRTPEDARRAFIYSEVFNRKY